MRHRLHRGGLLFGIAIAINLCVSSFAATYYVNAVNGNDSQTGLSVGTAWQTVAKVNAKHLSPGDVVLFARGQIWREELKVNGSGNDQHPVTIGAYGTGNAPVISGADQVSDWQPVSGSTYKAALASQPFFVFINDVPSEKGGNQTSLQNHQWFWSTGFLFLRNDSGDPNVGVLVEATQRTRAIGIWQKQYVVIDGLAAEKACNSDGWGAGIVAYDGATHITIRNCMARQSGHSGIYCIGAPESTVESCTSYDNYFTGIYLVDGSSDSRIRECIAFGNHYKGIDVELNSNNVVVEGCVTRDNLREGLDTDMVTNVVFSRCAVYGNGRGVNGNGVSVTRNATNIQFNYCTIFNNALHGIEVESGTGTTISNCTFYGNGEYNVGIKDANTTIKNCIFAEAQTGRQIAVYNSSGGATLDYNVYYAAAGFENSFLGTVYTDVSEWKSGTGQDAHSLNVDPRFVNATSGDFHLSVDSPCIDVGITLGLSPDISGVVVPQGLKADVGAFEFIDAQVPDLIPPTPGSLTVPAMAKSVPITISYSGATDSGGSGLKRVMLWIKRGDSGTWVKTTLSSVLPQGTLQFAEATGDMRYYFYLQAEDNAGNVSPPPSDAIVFDKAASSNEAPK